MSIQSQIEEQIVKKALKKIDIEALINSATPKLEAQIIKNVETLIRNYDFSDALYDAFPHKELEMFLKKRFIKSLKSK